jgi:hypothetical protein
MQCAPLNQIYFWNPEEFFQPVLNPEKMEEAHRMIELDQEIYIAFRVGFVSNGRAKQGEVRNAHIAKFISMSSKSFDGFIFGHGSFSMVAMDYRKETLSARFMGFRKGGRLERLLSLAKAQRTQRVSEARRENQGDFPGTATPAA